MGGHIECHVTFATYGKDIFVMKSHLANQDIVPKKGDAVYFGVTDSARGPEAANVRLIKAAGGASTVASPFAMMGANLLAAQMQSQSVQTVAGPSFVGEVKSFGNNGWGFIACQQTHSMF